jgi:SAM-dependent methyltransferase
MVRCVQDLVVTPPVRSSFIAPSVSLGTPAIHAGRHCPLCDGLGTPAGVCEGVELRLCCGALLAWAWEDEAAYEAWYRHPEAYPVLEQRANGQLPLPQRHAEQEQAAHARLGSLTALCSLPCSARMMDIGAGTGAFVEVAGRCYRAEGIEPCSAHVEAAQARGTPLCQGEWRSVQGHYDVITLFDVLEHLTRPLACLLHLRACLEPQGLLVIEMPEWDSPDQRRHGLEWKHIRPRQHLWLPSRAAAERLFERAEYEVLAFHRPLHGTLGKATWILTPTAATAEGNGSLSADDADVADGTRPDRESTKGPKGHEGRPT